MSLVWHPIAEKPDRTPTTAMIRCIDVDDGMHLVPGPVAWSQAEECWVDEDTFRPVEMTSPGAVYEWCYEADILGEPE